MGLRFDCDEWYEIPRSHAVNDKRLISQLPSVWDNWLVYDRKYYSLMTTLEGEMLLQLNNWSYDRRQDPPSYPFVRISLIANFTLEYTRIYLLSGPEEKDRARVLILYRDETLPITIKLLPVTMKEILAKLDEVAETWDYSKPDSWPKIIRGIRFSSEPSTSETSTSE